MPPIGASRSAGILAALLVASSFLTGCATTARSDGRVAAVGAESVYANIISQIGGRFVNVSSVVSNPLSDPHTYEVTAQVAQRIDNAQLIVQNGLGYDSYMNNVESATTTPGRHVLVVRQIAALGASTWNPHLWYSWRYMDRLARAIAATLAHLRPQHAAYFAKRLSVFELSLRQFSQRLVTFRRLYPHVNVATSEPVANYLLRDAGAVIRTPRQLQAAVMNGVDPSPQDIAQQRSLLSRHEVALLGYNEQVVDAFTTSLVSLANSVRPPIPIVALYETMPLSLDYQTWMNAELDALTLAVAQHRSTWRL